MPCLDFLARVREAHAEIATLGVAVIAVGTGSPAQAKRLMTAGSPFPCLVDGEKRLYAALGLGRLSLGATFRLETYLSYARAFRRGARQGARTGDWRQQSGVALFDADGCLAWLHRASTLGDYPALPGILGVLTTALARRAGP